MAKKSFLDPYAELIDKFNHRGVKYVVVGMSGINYYASDARETFSTQDFDIFIKPTLTNLKKTIAIFKEVGYSLLANGRGVKEDLLKDIVRQKQAIVATNIYGVMFELLLAVSGYTFSQMEGDAVIFDTEGVSVKVASLNKLLGSKRIAGREKDKLFLT